LFTTLYAVISPPRLGVRGYSSPRAQLDCPGVPLDRVPLLPFVWLPRSTALILAFVLSALVLFGVGAYEALTMVGDWRKKGLQMVVIGLGAAAIGFLIGRLFHTAGA
jgi:hypothetical protein